MNNPLPPSWLEHMLLLCLSARDRETVPGDLLEVYRDEKVPGLGPRGANRWYARQVLSFAPRAALRRAPLRPALALLCCFTAMCGLWLGFMDAFLHHRNIATHELIAAIIVGQAVLTLLRLRFRESAVLQFVVAAGCVALVWLAGTAIDGALTSVHFEGYILLIGILLLVQVVLTLLSFLQNTEGQQLPGAFR